MMKHTLKWCQTPPSMTVRIKPSNTRSRQVKRGLGLKRANGQEAQGPPRKSQPTRHQEEMYYSKMTTSPTIVIQRQEMASFFKLFDDDLIQDFLWMDCCCKITDKYLLAMTFVYFKRAHFTLVEYTRKNFFMALYLANTMEEDEEQYKYEIFPWALGKNWRKHFPRFLNQRDKLWARIKHRAAVSRLCCEKVMAILPSHFVWQRERSEHHSGAHRQYGHQDHTLIPRGPSASPVYCVFCTHGTDVDRGPSSTSPFRGSSAQTLDPMCSAPFTVSQSLEVTPPRTTTTVRKVENTRNKEQCSPCGCSEDVPRDESSHSSTYDCSMDWISKE